MAGVEGGWVPEACTLPTVEQPLRLIEFDELFATALWGQARIGRAVLRWSLDPERRGGRAGSGGEGVGVLLVLHLRVHPD